MKKILLISVFLFSQSALSQKDTLYLLIEKPFIQGTMKTNYLFGFTINSKDKRFVCDYYKFQIPSYKGWDEKGMDIYLNLEELKEEIDIDTIDYETVQSLQKGQNWWQLHNELSLKKKIYLLEKKIYPDYYYRKKDTVKYYVLPMIYEGTRKNIVPTGGGKI